MLTAQVTSFTINPEWVSAICNVLLLVLTGVSVYYAFQAYRHQKERSKKEAACDLAKYYASNVIDKYADITGVFDSAGITELVRNTFQLRDIQDFDKAELVRFLSNAKMSIEDFDKKLTSIDPATILNAKVSRACSEEERGRAFRSYTKVGEDGKIQIINGAFLRTDFEQEISGLLNELEWFAMNCKYGLADEEVLYQSLHQTYISTVWLLYFFISQENENNEDKLYTNVSWLFLKWRDRLMEIRDSKEAKKQGYLDKAEAVKAPLYEGERLK